MHDLSALRNLNLFRRRILRSFPRSKLSLFFRCFLCRRLLRRFSRSKFLRCFRGGLPDKDRGPWVVRALEMGSGIVRALESARQGSGPKDVVTLERGTGDGEH